MSPLIILIGLVLWGLGCRRERRGSDVTLEIKYAVVLFEGVLEAGVDDHLSSRKIRLRHSLVEGTVKADEVHCPVVEPYCD